MAEIVVKLVNGELAGKTAQMLAKEINAAAVAAKKAEIGTKAWIDANKRLTEAKELQEDLRKQTEATTKASDMLKNAWNNLPGAGFFNQITTSMGQAKSGVGGLVTQFGVLRGAIAATGIGALVIAVVALISYFTRFQSGMDMVSNVMSGLTNVIDTVLGRLGQLGKGLFEIASGQWSKGVDTISKSMDGLGSAIVDAFNEGYEISKATKELERFARMQNVVIARSKAMAEADRAIADDATRSFAVREAAAARARKGSEDAAKMEMDLAQQQMALIEQRIAQAQRQGSVNDDLLQEQADGMMRMIQAEKDYTMVTLENEKQRGELKQDRLEKDLDILIDGFDNVKTINERILGNDKITIDARIAKLRELQSLSDGTFERQVETIQKFTGVQVDAYDLLNTADAQALNQKIRNLGLSEIIEGRLLEVIRERRVVLADLAEFETNLNEEKLAEEAAYQQRRRDALNSIQDMEVATMEEGREKDLEGLKVSLLRQLEALDQHGPFYAERMALIQEQARQKRAEINSKWDEQDLENALQADTTILTERFLAGEVNEQQYALLTAERTLGFEQQRLDLIRSVHGEESQEYQSAYANFLQLKRKYAEETSKIQAEISAKELESVTGSLNVMAGFMSNLGSLYQQGTAQFKAFAIAAAIMSTIEGAINAYTSALKIPYVGTALAPIAAAAALAAGYARVRQIQNTKVSAPVSGGAPKAVKVSKFEKGGLLRGPRHSSGGIPIEAEGGEFIFSRQAVAGFGAARLEAMNNYYTRKFATGGPVDPFSDRGAVSRTGEPRPSVGVQADADSALVQEVRGLRGDIKAFKTRLKAFVVLSELEGQKKKMDDIRNDADV